jgi:hypothetical protein
MALSADFTIPSHSIHVAISLNISISEGLFERKWRRGEHLLSKTFLPTQNECAFGKKRECYII